MSQSLHSQLSSTSIERSRIRQGCSYEQWLEELKKNDPSLYLKRSVKIRKDIRGAIDKHANEVLTNKIEVDKSIEQRIREVKYWRNELLSIVEDINIKNESVKQLLKFMSRYYEKLLHQRDVAKTCLNKRDYRMGIELVNDNVNTALNKEFEYSEVLITEFEENHDFILNQLRENDGTVYKIRLNIVKMFHTLQIENYVHNLSHLTHSTLKEDLILADNYESIPETWISHAENLKDEGLKCLENTMKMLDEMSFYYTNRIREASENWHRVNKCLRERIFEVTEAYEKIQFVIKKINEGVSSLRFDNDKLNNESELQKRYLLLAQNRLTTRKCRSDIENCDDETNFALRAEIKDITKRIEDLQSRHQSIIDTIVSLEKMKLEREKDLANKNNTLHYDKDVCLMLRSKWPNGPLSTCTFEIRS